MISLLIGLLVLVLVVYIAFWIIGQMGLPQPARMIVTCIVGILALLWLLRYVGYGSSLHL